MIGVLFRYPKRFLRKASSKNVMCENGGIIFYIAAWCWCVQIFLHVKCYIFISQNSWIAKNSLRFVVNYNKFWNRKLTITKDAFCLPNFVSNFINVLLWLFNKVTLHLLIVCTMHLVLRKLSFLRICFIDYNFKVKVFLINNRKYLIVVTVPVNSTTWNSSLLYSY